MQMKQKLKDFYQKHTQLILYFAFGLVTTVTSLTACYLTLKFGVLIWHDEHGNPTKFLDVLGSTNQWIVGVLTSFFTSKKWVFTNAARGFRASARQLLTFSSSRIGTYFLEVFINLGIIALLGLVGYTGMTLPLLFGKSLSLSPRFWAKVFSSVLVVFVNYFISKLFVFKDKKNQCQSS